MQFNWKTHSTKVTYDPLAIILPRLCMPDMCWIGMLKPCYSADHKAIRTRSLTPIPMYLTKLPAPRISIKGRRECWNLPQSLPNVTIGNQWQDSAKCSRAKQAALLSASTATKCIISSTNSTDRKVVEHFLGRETVEYLTSMKTEQRFLKCTTTKTLNMCKAQIDRRE